MTLGCYAGQFGMEEIQLKEVEGLVETDFWRELYYSMLHILADRAIHEYSEKLDYRDFV